MADIVEYVITSAFRIAGIAMPGQVLSADDLELGRDLMGHLPEDVDPAPWLAAQIVPIYRGSSDSLPPIAARYVATSPVDQMEGIF